MSIVERVWPDLDPARIVYEDDDLIAVDKAEGVPSQSADPEHPDGLDHRLRRFLAARDEVERPYLGVHQRLDQDTSGVLVYTKDKRANAGLAKQLEGRTVDKRYAALVEGWKGSDRTLVHALVRGKDGRTHVARRNDRRAKKAVTHVRVIERRGGRALLELRIETGRTHQIRAQLAAEGAPIVGDRLYGGAPADRMMLHAASIGLAHPVTGAPLKIESPPPSRLREGLGEGPGRLGTRVQDRDRPSPQPPPAGGRGSLIDAARERRWGLAHRALEDAPTNAFRLIDEGGDGLPGLAVDVYGEWLVAHLYDDALAPDLDSILDALHELGFRGVYLKRRPKQANLIVDGRDETYAPAAPVRGEAAPEPLAICEHGVPYLVRLGEGLSTGIFLDQRDNRRRVMDLCGGARVLNLFSYTCAFTVAAAVAGASETHSVDASARLLEWGRDNLAHAGVAPDRHRFTQADVFETLDAIRRDGARYDLVIVDPPTYSKTKASRWTSGKDWVALGAACLSVLAPGGRLLACSNDRRMRQNAFRRHLHEAARRAGKKPTQMKDLPCPPDFPPPPGEEPHLKSALIST